MNNKQQTKGKQAAEVCWRWERDWAGEKGTVEPKAGEIIRAMAWLGWAGHQRAISEVYSIDQAFSKVASTRPAEVRKFDGGKAGYGITRLANLDKARRVLARYLRFYEYMKETRHAWQVIETVNYADNSAAVRERSILTGAVRERMTLAPGGDLCF